MIGMFKRKAEKAIIDSAIKASRRGWKADQSRDDNASQQGQDHTATAAEHWCRHWRHEGSRGCRRRGGRHSGSLARTDPIT
jgi:hypothetical protein